MYFFQFLSLSNAATLVVANYIISHLKIDFKPTNEKNEEIADMVTPLFLPLIKNIIIYDFPVFQTNNMLAAGKDKFIIMSDDNDRLAHISQLFQLV